MVGLGVKRTKIGAGGLGPVLLEMVSRVGLGVNSNEPRNAPRKIQLQGWWAVGGSAVRTPTYRLVVEVATWAGTKNFRRSYFRWPGDGIVPGVDVFRNRYK